MNWFNFIDGELFAEDRKVTDLARNYGTPLYIYSKATLVRHINTIDGAFHGIDHLTCFSVKANSNISILKILTKHGIGVDIVSGGELYRVLQADIPPERIVYSGVGKTEAEIRYALDSDILMFNVESESELKTINRIAGDMNKKAPLAFRINPDVNPKTHPYISTGLKTNKFGIPHNEALSIYKVAADLPHVEVIGIDAHIGSQLIDISPFRDAAERLRDLIGEISSIGIDLKIVDIGGGLGIRYEDETPPEPSEWARIIIPILRETGCRLIIEPGRSMVGNAGILVTKVLYIKKNDDKTFVIVDAGMNDIARPSLYDSYHSVVPLRKRKIKKSVVDIVGPICESGDFIAKDRHIILPKEGDYLAILSAGAYGMTMASNYNSRPRAAEIMVDLNKISLIRERETIEDLVAKELI